MLASVLCMGMFGRDEHPGCRRHLRVSFDPKQPRGGCGIGGVEKHLRRIPLVSEALLLRDSVLANQQPSVLHMGAVSIQLMTAMILVQRSPVRTRACCITRSSTASFDKDEQRGRWCRCLLVAWGRAAAASERPITSRKIHYLNPHTQILQCLHLEISGPYYVFIADGAMQSSVKRQHLLNGCLRLRALCRLTAKLSDLHPKYIRMANFSGFEWFDCVKRSDSRPLWQTTKMQINLPLILQFGRRRKLHRGRQGLLYFHMQLACDRLSLPSTIFVGRTLTRNMHQAVASTLALECSKPSGLTTTLKEDKEASPSKYDLDFFIGPQLDKAGRVLGFTSQCQCRWTGAGTIGLKQIGFH